MKTKLISAVSILFILLTCCLPFFPSYSLNNHAASDYPEYQEEVDRILSEIKPSMSDLEKALAVHEYFIRNYKYGKADEAAILDYSEFDVFVNKSGVCESMTKAYKYIMDLLGISCIEADSPSMNHTWNMIKLDGYWYHVDVTFDLSGSPGSGQHQNFLLSDIGIAASGSSGHYGWTSTEKATNTQYDNAFWSMIRSYMYYNNGYWYYVDTGEVKHYGFVTDLSNQTPYGTISRYNFSSDEKTAVFKVDSIKYSYSDITGSTQEKTWKGNNTRLAMYNEKLYYNTYNQIFFINTDGSGNTPVCTVDIMGDSNIPDASSCIDGFIIKYGNIFYTNSYQSDQTYWTAALPSAAPMYAFKVSSNNGGTISPQYDVKVFGSTSRTFTLLPKEGFTVGDIIVDGVSVGPASVYSFKNVKADHSIQVVFKNTFAGSTAGSSSIASSGISAEEYSSWRLVSIAEQPDDKLYSFNKGSAILRKNNLCTVIDMNGNKTMPWLSTGMELGWEQASLSAGLYNVSSNGLSGYVDLTGKPIVPCEYSYIYFIAENLISAEKNGKRGLLDTTGSVILPFEYDSLYKNENGRIVVTKNGISKVLDDSGKLVSFTVVYDYSNMVNIQFKDGKWGIQNGLGKIIVPYEYDGIKNFSEGIAQLQKDGRIGYTDKKGKMIALPTYDNGGDFHEGMAWVVQNGKYGYINSTGSLVVPCVYSYAGDFNDGHAKVQQGLTNGFINTSGEMAIPQIYEDTGTYSDGVVPVKLDDKWSILVEPVYTKNDSPSSWAKDEVTAALNNGLVPHSMQSNYRNRITREDFCKLAVNLLTVKTGKSIQTLLAEKAVKLDSFAFTDTSSFPVLAANALGIVNGVGNRAFNPNGSITRQEAAAMIQRTARLLGVTDSAGSKLSFKDSSSFSSWATAPIGFVASRTDKSTGKSIMGGTGSNMFSPAGTYTREQSYLTILRLYNSF